MIIPIFLISIDNAARAEFLLSWIHQLANRQKRGHALLVFDGTHPEFVDRCKATAELAFESFDILIPASKDTPQKMASENVRRNNLFLSAFEYAQKSFRCPFLAMTPECTPTNPQWLDRIEDAYDNQPRRYMLTHLQDAKDAPRFPLGVGVMHMGLFNDIAAACAAQAETPWERVAGETIVSRSTKTRMFQPLKVVEESDLSKVWPEAQIVVGDTSGALVEHLRAQGVHLPNLSAQHVPSAIVEQLVPGLGKGQSILWHPKTIALTPPRVTLDPPNLPPQITQPNPTCATKPDLRTKAGREWKAAHANGNGH